MPLTRRTFLQSAAAAALLSPDTARRAAAQAVSTDSVFDLVVKGGEVLDPSQGLRAKLDLGLKNGLVAAVEPDIPATLGKQLLDAAGKLVLPGLVDLHTHVYPQGAPLALPADDLAPYTGTTTFVDAGDAGVNNFSAFKHEVIARSRSRIFAFLNVSTIGLLGFPAGELLNKEHMADAGLAAKILAENQDVLLGMKVRASNSVVGSNGLEPIKRALAALAGAGTQGRLMVHIGDAPGELSVLLDMLRPGDILTHAYSGAGNNVVQNGKLLPAATAAQQRGVIIDVGHGAGSFDYTIAEAALAQGLIPDTISSDLHALTLNGPGKGFLPWVMSKFLNLGFELEQVVKMVTINPARVVGRVEKLGTLRIGAPADVAIMQLVEEPVEFVDTKRNTRKGTRYLKPLHTIRAGRPFGPPFPIPYGYP